jgi:hypothetical protein
VSLSNLNKITWRDISNELFGNAKWSLYEKVTTETIEGIFSAPVYFQRA